jgi:oxygen-independent coproporphyrinogen-3 oxidase
MNVPRLNNKTSCDPPQAVGLYVHIPYCTRKCPYCSFASTAAKVIPQREYLDCLKNELEKVLINKQIGSETALDSIYFGGGTPSLFEPSLIGELIKAAHARLAPDANIEVTLEVNPDSAEPERLKELRRVGVNRLSIGMQSLDDKELEKLGRLHDSKKALEAFRCARAAGFKNIGVDIIIGTPSQNMESLSNTIAEVIKLRPEHISAYCLSIEEGTPYETASQKGRLSVPDSDAQRRMYLMTIERLEAAGYIHYEVSNFALVGMESRHNSRYWTGGDYIGIGAGAHSFASGLSTGKDWGRRWWNIKDGDQYMKLINKGASARAGAEELTKEQARTEAIMLGLRQTRGIDEEAFARRFSGSPVEYLTRCDIVKAQGLICSAGGRLKLTKEGLLLSGEVY